MYNVEGGGGERGEGVGVFQCCIQLCNCVAMTRVLLTQQHETPEISTKFSKVFNFNFQIEPTHCHDKHINYICLTYKTLNRTQPSSSNLHPI